MRQSDDTSAKPFYTEDVFGTPISLDLYQGKKLLLSFLRFTGCPVCNLHIHQWLDRRNNLEESNVEIVIVLESPIGVIRKFVREENLPFTFVSETNNVLYNNYEVEKSWLQYFLILFSLDIWIRAFKGWSLYNVSIPMQGRANRVESEFLIDEHGMIIHYTPPEAVV
jgi:peroxiredoxin Q/BCP